MDTEEQEVTFRRWLSDHLGLMLKVVRSCAISPEDQEDLFQEILLQVWSSIPAFHGEAKETTWIYRVAFNTALVWRRGEKRRHTRHETLLKLDVTLHAQPSHVDVLRDQEIVELLYASIRQLPGMDGALVLLYLDDRSYREMADVLGISESNVGVKLNRAKKALADLMNEVTHEA